MQICDGFAPVVAGMVYKPLVITRLQQDMTVDLGYSMYAAPISQTLQSLPHFSHKYFQFHFPSPVSCALT